MKRKKLTAGEIGGLAIIVFIVVGLLIGVILDYRNSRNDHDYSITVRDKERVHKTNSIDEEQSEDYYLIYAKNNDTGELIELRIEDVPFRDFYQSSAVFNQLEIGKSYTITCVGYRNHRTSEYENIIAIKE